MEKIIIGTDFSEVAGNAVNYGVNMALALNADIILFHAYQLPVPFPQVSITTDEELKAYAENNMRLLKEKIQNENGEKLAVSTETRLGSFFSGLNDLCEEVKPYLVIIGTNGEKGSGRLLFGSEAIHTLKHLLYPVIAVPPQATFSDIKKIGLACDFQKVLNGMPVNEIERLVLFFDAEFHILNSGKPGEFDPETVFESGMLKGILKKLDPQYHFISSDNTDEAILDAAEKLDLDLLMVLPKRHSLIDKIIHRSHTKQFTLHSHIPVLALHL